MSYVCKVCKLEFFSQSYGGPDICPSCDCGIDPKLRQAQTEVLHLTKQSAADKAEIERLRGEVAGLRKELDAMNAAAWSFTHSWVNNEVDQDDEDWLDVMADLTAKADTLFRLCTPPIEGVKHVRENLRS